MRLLLDENLPKRLKFDFTEHEVFTVREKGWNGLRNGELLILVISNGFDALIPFDKNLEYQQNFTKFPIAVIVLSAPDNTYQTLTTLSKRVIQLLKNEPLPKGISVVSN